MAEVSELSRGETTAKNVFTAMAALVGISWVVRLAGHAAFGWQLERDDAPGWLVVLAATYVSVMLGSALVWLELGRRRNHAIRRASRTRD